MAYTLWRGEQLLGESELETPSGAGRAGIFRPTAAFEGVRPVLDRWQALTKQSARVMENRRADLPPAESVRQALEASGLGAELVARHREVEALGLTLRDAAGAPAAAAELIVWEMEVPAWPEMPEELRVSVEADFAAAGMKLGGPNYVLVMLREGGRASLPEPAAGA